MELKPVSLSSLLLAWVVLLPAFSLAVSERSSGKKERVVAIFAPIALPSFSRFFSRTALHCSTPHCTAHSTKVPHFLIRRRRSPPSVGPSVRLRAIFGCFPRPFSASVYARASARASSLSQCMFGMRPYSSPEFGKKWGCLIVLQFYYRLSRFHSPIPERRANLLSAYPVRSMSNRWPGVVRGWAGDGFGHLCPRQNSLKWAFRVRLSTPRRSRRESRPTGWSNWILHRKLKYYVCV